MQHVLQKAEPIPATWLLFLAQLPAAPSSARVALWRRLRAAGAASVLNGAWVLPVSDAHAALFAQLADTARSQGGSATVFTATVAAGPDEAAILARFEADRARDYDEFADRAAACLAEIDRETRRRKFTFAELEEIEDDVAKLTTWLARIAARDFFPTARGQAAAATLDACAAALRGFAAEVYATEGLHAPAADSVDAPDA